PSPAEAGFAKAGGFGPQAEAASRVAKVGGAAPEAGGPKAAAAEPAAAEAKARPRRGIRAVLWVVALALVIGAAGSWREWAPYVAAYVGVDLAGPAPSEELPALTARVEALEEQVVRAAAAFAELEGERDVPTGALGSLAGRVAALERALSELQERLGEAGPEPGTVAALADRVAALEQTVRAPVAAEARGEAADAGLEASLRQLSRELADLRAGAAANRSGLALMLAVGQMREALRTSGPFIEEIEAVQALAADDPAVAEALAAFSGRAEAGVPTAAELAGRFDGVAGAVVRAATAAGDGGWVEQALAGLASVVTVRPSGGEVGGTGPGAAVARAEARLGAGDLDGAVAALAPLRGPAAAAAADWLDDARARLGAERGLKALHAHAARVLARAGGPAP
ncbi:MAG: COG4223 family protein, partial [Alphaproteobacteria bacterium]